MRNGTASKTTRPASFAAHASTLALPDSLQLPTRAKTRSSQSTRSAPGNNTRAYPLQSRKSLPLEFPESHDSTPTPSEADHTHNTGRHQFAVGPRSAP